MLHANHAKQFNLNVVLASSPGVDLLPHFVVDSSRTAAHSRACQNQRGRRRRRRRRRLRGGDGGGYKCRWLWACGRRTRTRRGGGGRCCLWQQQRTAEEETAAAANHYSGVGKYINEIHGREREGNKDGLGRLRNPS